MSDGRGPRQKCVKILLDFNSRLSSGQDEIEIEVRGCILCIQCIFSTDTNCVCRFLFFFCVSSSTVGFVFFTAFSWKQPSAAAKDL